MAILSFKHPWLATNNRLKTNTYGTSKISCLLFSLQGAFKEKYNINFELLSDSNKRTIHDYEMYHCNFICDVKGDAKRGVIVVDSSGTVAYVEETANSGTQVNFTALKEALQAIK